MFDQELEQFKKIDLRGYAATQGYVLDRKESWRGSAVMRHSASDDKIIIKLGPDGHYQWFSVRTNVGGTIIDFVQHVRGLSLGEVRKELRPWIGVPAIPVPAFTALECTDRDRDKVLANYARMNDASGGHPYLEIERAIPSSLLAHARFAGRVRIDRWRNAVFPHFDADGLCGYELKNKNFTGYAAGGTKGLWLSHQLDGDDTIVFCESAIDALSFATLFGAERVRYASIGGQTNPKQPALISTAIKAMPAGSEVVAAMDADVEGRKLAEIVREAVRLTGRPDLHFEVCEPVDAKDWNDALRASLVPELPSRGRRGWRNERTRLA